MSVFSFVLFCCPGALAGSGSARASRQKMPSPRIVTRRKARATAELTRCELTAGNGAEGLALARDLMPALITLDMLMPGLDGWSVLKKLKADPALTGCEIKIQK